MVDALPTPAPNVRTGLRTGIFAQIWRRRWIFTGTLLLTLCAVAGLVVTLQVRYSASGSVIVAEQEPGAAAASAAWVQKLGDPADLESQLLLIRSSRMLRLALARPGVVEAIQRECAQAQTGSAISKLLSRSENPCAKLLPDSDALLDWAGTRYSVSSVGRSRVIAIAYQSGVPETARDVANALIQAYLEDQRAVTANSRETTAAWLWQEVAQIDAALRDEEARIQAFRRANGLVRGQLAPISSERLTSINQQLSIAQAAQAEAAARLQEMQRGRATPGDSRAVLDSRAVADVKQQLASTAAQIASASETLGPNHPTLAALRRQRDELQARIGSEASSISTSAVRAYAAAGTQVATLQRQLDAMKQEVGSASDNEAEIASMVRGVEIKRALYVDLYKRASDLETERRVLVGSTRLVSLAELPSLPSFPKRMPFAAAGLTLALVLATVAAMLRDLADRSVRAGGRCGNHDGHSGVRTDPARAGHRRRGADPRPQNGTRPHRPVGGGTALPDCAGLSPGPACTPGARGDWRAASQRAGHVRIPAGGQDVHDLGAGAARRNQWPPGPGDRVRPAVPHLRHGAELVLRARPW